MSASDERQLIIDLPLQQRTIAVALKHVFDKIKKLEEEQGQETQAVHQSFIERFKAVEQEASKIIRGRPIPPQALQNKQTYFSNDQLPKVEEIRKSNKGIDAYWLTVFLNFYGDDMSTSDKEIATAIVDIQTNVTIEKLQLTFQLAANPWLAAGNYTKTFLLKDGIPIKSQGTKADWLKKQPEGVLSTILNDNFPPEETLAIFQAVANIINEIVPYSLEYFLGAVEEDDGQQEEQQDLEDDQQEEDEEQEEAPAKKVKK